jgi:hypothetical protein
MENYEEEKQSCPEFPSPEPAMLNGLVNALHILTRFCHGYVLHKWKDAVL